MEGYTLGVIEGQFADMIWEKAPVPTTEVVKECARRFEWKRTTTYTVLKKFIKRGIFENSDGVVRVLMTRDEFYARQSRAYVEQNFKGSLPTFLAAFTSGRKLTAKEIREVEAIIGMNGKGKQR